MEETINTIWQFLLDSGFGQFHWTNGVMILVGLLFIWLAVKKGFEPLLLVPIGFGILIGNIPYPADKLPLSVYDGPVSEHDLHYYTFTPMVVVDFEGRGKVHPVKYSLEKKYTFGQELDLLETQPFEFTIYSEYAKQIAESLGKEVGEPVEAPTTHDGLMELIRNSYAVIPGWVANEKAIAENPTGTVLSIPEIHYKSDAMGPFYYGLAVMVNTHSTLGARKSPVMFDEHLVNINIDEQDQSFEVKADVDAVLKGQLPPQILSYGQGRFIFYENPIVKRERQLREANPDFEDLKPEEQKQLRDNWTDDGKYYEVWSEKKQDPYNASIMWWLYTGVGVAGFFPPLIFLGIGALTDFGPMLSNPKTLLLGAAAQFGIFGALLGALALGFSPAEAGSIGIIGGADGPTAIFTCSQLAPDLLGAVALAAYSYMAMVPIIQPPIIKLLTSKKERLIHMTQKKPVSRSVKIIFPVMGFLLTAFLVPGGLPLLGMLFFGNLLRESLVTERLSKTAQGPLIDIVTILLGISVGAKTSASSFLTLETIFIFILGVAAFAIATAAGVIFGKVMNWLSKEQINPMIGAAGVSAVPMAARVVHKLGQDEDPQNFLIMHAMGPNVAGVIGSAVAAGVLLSSLAGK